MAVVTVTDCAGPVSSDSFNPHQKTLPLSIIRITTSVSREKVYIRTYTVTQLNSCLGSTEQNQYNLDKFIHTTCTSICISGHRMSLTYYTRTSNTWYIQSAFYCYIVSRSQPLFPVLCTSVLREKGSGT